MPHDDERGGRAPDWIAEVTALAAHELGNSMTALGFAMDLLRDRQRSADERREVDELRSIVASAAALVRLIARLSSGPTAVARIDLAEVLAEAAPLLVRLGRRTLQCEIPRAPVRIVAARSDVERALVEMVRAVASRAPAARLAVDVGTGAHARIAVEGAVPAAEATPELPLSAALAASCGGSLASARTADGALRIELTLPAASGDARR